MANMWMVRSDGGRHYDTFLDDGIVAMSGSASARPGIAREVLLKRFQEEMPSEKPSTLASKAAQTWRFLNEVKLNDWVITYSPLNRVYLVGQIVGGAENVPQDEESQGLTLQRKVKWSPTTVLRDALSQRSKNSLGSVLAFFQVRDFVKDEILAAQRGETRAPAPTQPLVADAEDVEEDHWADVETQSLERIKDLVANLDWSEMQDLIAGILRAMGYKTQISAHGPDRGKDIIASPDGFGFEHPRIIVEVKHRKGQMGSQEIRSFLGGRHPNDRGLYVSTGGFSREAHYEAERASIPVALWTLDHVVRTLIENYDATDSETKRLVPLKRLYWPA